MNSDLLYSIENIFGSYLGDKKYIIPAYQRGYKWEAKDVTRLLDDIATFEPNEELDLFYCLQNITLVEAKDNVDGSQSIKGYNVVDGQQRLTTLIVILSFLQEYQIIKDKIEYNVRPQTEDFIREYLYQKSNLGEFPDWDSFLKYCDENGKDYNYQDIFYLFQSYKTVSKWFKAHPDKETMKDKILHNVKMIVNLTKNVEEQDLFENLNGKRVPLDGADLIRAIIITRVAKQEIVEFEGTIKANVILNERRIRIGMALDEMNRWWSQSEVFTYFRNFAKEAKVEAGSAVAFNDEIYPINHLFKLYVLAFSNGNLSMDTFEKESVEDGFFDKLVDFHRTLQDWYRDQELYHLILFAYLYGGKPDNKGKIQSSSFQKIYLAWKDKSKREFIDWLKERIQENDEIKDLIPEKDESSEENESKAFEEYYFDAKYICIYVLLDIIDILKSPNRINRLPARNFKAADEDLEHIFPQTPIGDRVKNPQKQTQILKMYIETINTFIKEGEWVQIDENAINWKDGKWRETTRELINGKLWKVIPINSLGNICLLHRNVNRGYGNDFFLDKRIDVMRKSQDGLYVRPHVYDAFNKVFLERKPDSIEVNAMTRWDKSDILARRKNIIEKISDFLK